MAEKQHLQTPFPKGMAKDMYCARAGKIAFALAVVAGLFSLVSVMSAVAPYIIVGIIYLFAVAIMILTLFTIFVYKPEFWDDLNSAIESFLEASEFVEGLWRYVIPITIGLAAVSFLFLFLDRGVRHVSRYIVLIAMSVIFAIAAIVKAGLG